MGISLTITHTCLPCLPSGRTLFWSDLLVAEKVASWERWDGSEYGRWERWEGSKLEDGKGGRVVGWASPRFHFLV